MNFLNSYDTNVESAYIITLPNSETSQKLTQQCVESCEAVGQPYKLWEGFDGSSGYNLIEYNYWSDFNGTDANSDGVFDETYNGDSSGYTFFGDVILTKFSSNGENLVYSTFIGGNRRKGEYPPS